MNLKRFPSNERGAAAAEFAILMVPVIALVLVSMQTGIVFFLDQALQTATKQAARQIMTGSAQTSSTSQSAFKNSVCGYATEFTCGNLMVDVESGSNFSAINTANLTPTYNGSGTPSNTWSYSPGGPGDIVIIRVMYDWPIFGGPLAVGLGNQPDGGRLLVATVVFKNEPYSAS